MVISEKSRVICEHCGRLTLLKNEVCPSCGGILSVKSLENPPKIMVNWSGSAYALCCGNWTIKINGKILPIPKDKIKEHMNTFGVYSNWYFNDDWMEVWEDYEDGLYFDDWLIENKEWIDKGLKSINIEPNDKLYFDLFSAIQENDWRHNSCGGCI